MRVVRALEEREMFQFEFRFDQHMVTGRLILPIESRRGKEDLAEFPAGNTDCPTATWKKKRVWLYN